MIEYIVVGSGPAGVAAAKALLANKQKVLMLDAGKSLPEKQRNIISSLQNQNPRAWRLPGSSDPLQKKKFGSAYMYQTPELRLKARNAHVNASFARGGLSSVWGAAILPYDREDMCAWPKLDLAPYYKKVLSFIPLAGVKDALAKQFPLYAEPEELKSSSQAQSLFAHWKRRQTQLRESGFIFGHSRLAVKSYPVKEQSGCVYCGMCMSGCPVNAIYSAEHTLMELRSNENFKYVPGVVVTRVGEKSGVPVVHATHHGKKVSFSGKKVFLAAGVFSTANIMLRSKNMEAVTIRDSQYIIIPCITWRRGQLGRQHALTQAFIELQDKEFGSVHLQVYTYSNLIERGVADKLGKLYTLFKPVLRPLIERLVVVQGFLHSDVSGTLFARRTETGLLIEGKCCLKMKRLPKVLLRHVGKLWLLPLMPFVEYGLPGQGFHSGGSFPMSSNPKGTQSDELGRCGFENIHVVDSSVMPNLSGPITLTEMANAYRIADIVSLGAR